MPLPGFMVQQNLMLFRELVSCGAEIYSWVYDAEGQLLETNCEGEAFNIIFERTGCHAYAVAHAAQSTAPLILGARLGIIWCAAIEPLEDTCHIHVLGPVLNTDISYQLINQLIDDASGDRDVDLDPQWRDSFIRRIQALPVLNAVLLNQYALQLHYCLTGEKLDRGDIIFQQSEAIATPEQPVSAPRDRHQTYMAELALLRCVREGDLNFHRALSRASTVSSGVRVRTEQPMMQVYISIASFTNLCVRAAIEGGLSPDTAYTVGDTYIQNMLACKTVAEAGALNHAMYEDFVRRVHKIRTNPTLSPAIRSCREYIELHTDEPLSLAFLAQKMGYSESYLSRRFKKETGIGVSNYIHFSRIERARTLLITTDLTISEIAAQLQYCSSTHFSAAFRKVTGMLPQKYRKEHQVF